MTVADATKARQIAQRIANEYGSKKLEIQQDKIGEGLRAAGYDFQTSVRVAWEIAN